jgi:hypothetical protein
MALKILSFRRVNGQALLVCRDPEKGIVEKVFPASMADSEIFARLSGQKAPAQTPENPEDVPPPAEPPVTPNKGINEQLEEQRALKDRYLADLKACGVDIAGLRAFSKIEALWQENCNKKGGK